jgi:ABC-2 type transport system ATP-binding protein
MIAASGSREGLVVDRLNARLGQFHLETVSFRVVPGHVTALLGHNGAGKTTTFRVIMGMVRKDSGQVRLGALDHVQDERRFKQRTGFVQEESFFYSAMTVCELAAFVSPFYDNWNSDLAEKLIRMFDLPRDRKVAEFSKGMRMKTSLVLALSHEPDVLLLDEPTSGLDPRARVEILTRLQSAAHEGGAAVLFSTHNLYEVDRVADRVIVVDRGRVLADEDLAGLRRAGGSSWTLEQYYLELVP